MKKLFLIFITISLSVFSQDLIEYRTIVTRNDQIVNGEFHLELQAKIANGLSPRTINSISCDVYFTSQLTTWGTGFPGENWAFGSSEGYSRSVTENTGFYNVTVTGNGVNENGDGTPAGWNITNEWQTVVTLRWYINETSAVQISISDENAAAAVFNNLSNNPPGSVTSIEAVNYDLGEVSLFNPGPVTLILQPEPADAKDASLEMATSWYGSGDYLFGSSSQLRVGVIDLYGWNIYRRRRAILRFDLSDIPTGATIQEAKFRLCLRANECDNTTQVLDIHRIKVDWDEPTCCWNRPETGASDWTGCEPNNTWAVSTASVSKSCNKYTSGWVEWTGTGMRNLVQNWVSNPTINLGMLVKLRYDAVDDRDRQFRFHSSDVTDETIRPVLEVTYEQ